MKKIKITVLTLVTGIALNGCFGGGWWQFLGDLAGEPGQLQLQRPQLGTDFQRQRNGEQHQQLPFANSYCLRFRRR